MIRSNESVLMKTDNWCLIHRSFFVSLADAY